MKSKLNTRMGLEITTTEKIKKIGNSYYVNIRKDIRKKLKLTEEDLIEIKIKKIPDNPK